MTGRTGHEGEGMQQNSAKVVSCGRPVCRLGADFWSRRGGPRYWPDFQPAADRIDEQLIDRSRDLYGDVWLVAYQAWFAGRVVKRLSDHPSMAGWLLSDAVRAAGSAQPTSTRPEASGSPAWTTVSRSGTSRRTVDHRTA